jgi:hypothetical protein
MPSKAMNFKQPPLALRGSFASPKVRKTRPLVLLDRVRGIVAFFHAP